MHKYTPKESSFIKRHVAGRSMKEMTELFNMQHFGEPITVDQMKSFMGNNKLRNGRDGRFKPGLVPVNKGLKGYCPEVCKKSWFGKGHKPANFLPLGSERVTKDGYVQVKISNTKKPPKRRWRMKQVLLWEKAHGKIPKGHVVIFADRNIRNFALDNLLLITRGELLVMNKLGLISSHKELTKAGKAVADIKMAIAARKRKSHSKQRRPA